MFSIFKSYFDVSQFNNLIITVKHSDRSSNNTYLDSQTRPCFIADVK